MKDRKTLHKKFPLIVTKEVEETMAIQVGNVSIGKGTFTLMAGPCAVESDEQLERIAKKVSTSGAHVLRGGAFKPRTSPYSFQGLEREGLKHLKNASEKNNIPVISEITEIGEIGAMEESVDILQVGARNMQNFALLKALGKSKTPVLLKRGFGAQIEELLGAAEYILEGGNENVMLCERGIRTFENMTRTTLDLSAVPVIKNLTHLPVIVDPSHAAGRPDIIESLSLAACAAGADGLIIEVHDKPEEALCDGDQALDPDELKEIVEKLKKIAPIVDKEFK